MSSTSCTRLQHEHQDLPTHRLQHEHEHQHQYLPPHRRPDVRQPSPDSPACCWFHINPRLSNQMHCNALWQKGPQKLQFRRKTTVFRLTRTRMLISEKSKIWEMYFGDIWTVGKCTSAKTAVISRTDFKWGRWKSWILYSGLWTVSTQPIFPKTRRQKIVIDTRKCCEILKFCCRQERILQLLTSVYPVFGRGWLKNRHCLQ